MAKKLTVVVSQGQSANPQKRKLEEDLVAALLFERGVEVTVVPHLYDLAPDGTGMLCLQSIPGDLVVLSWLFPRAAHWTLDRNGIHGKVGQTLLVAESDEDEEDDGEDQAAAMEKQRVLDGRPVPNRTIYCLDLKVKAEVQPFVEEVRRIQSEASVQTVSLLGPFGGSLPLAPREQAASIAVSEPPSEPLAVVPSESPQPTRVAEETGRRWYPVIDYSRCTNCMECIDFCLFGVYGVDRAETILVEQPDNCRKGCPACSRVCPENAIVFPQHKTPSIAGSADGSVAALKIDLSKLFGAPDALQVAALERDVELVAVGRDAVGMSVGIPKRQPEKSKSQRDDLDNLMDELDRLEL